MLTATVHASKSGGVNTVFEESFECLLLEEKYETLHNKCQELHRLLQRLQGADSSEAFRISRLTGPLVDDICVLRRLIDEEEEEAAIDDMNNTKHPYMK